MTNLNELIASIIKAGDGSIVGRIRIQKIFYLLEQLGMESGLSFSYYHYGPYSEDLSSAIEFAKVTELEEKREDTDYGFYSIFSLKTDTFVPPKAVGKLSWEQTQELVQTMKAETSTVLELAATIHWLKQKEHVLDWNKELKARKGAKAEDERIDKAVTLLETIGLAA